jgi:hypothetical protein
MNQGICALYQEPETAALPSLGLPAQGHPEIFRVILEFEGCLGTKPRHHCGASLFESEGSGIMLTDVDVGNAGVAGAFTCHDPRAS